MSKVVKLSDYRRTIATEPEPEPEPESEPEQAMRDGLLPVVFAMANKDREHCLKKISQYRVNSEQPRERSDEPGSLLYFIGVSEAIAINKKIIELEELSEEELKQRIDLVQVMENMKFSRLDNLWQSASSESDLQLR